MAVEEVYRCDWGRIVAALIKQGGDFDPAEERAQEALAAAIYLLFNEGYAATSGKALVRADLCSEAITLARLLAT